MGIKVGPTLGCGIAKRGRGGVGDTGSGGVDASSTTLGATEGG